MTTALEEVYIQSEEAEYYEAQELAGKMEFLQNDPIASFRAKVGQKSVGLEYFVDRKEGAIKKSFTLKEARALAMRPDWQPFTRTKSGRVPREVVLDQLADKFNIPEDDLVEYIENLAPLKSSVRKRTLPKVSKEISPQTASVAPLVIFITGVLVINRILQKTGFQY